MNSNFLEFINKDIDGKRTLLASMPTRTKTNKKNFNSTLDEMIKKYQDYESNVFKYLTAKSKSLSKFEENESLEKIKEKVVCLERIKFLLNPSNTYLEKMGFDTLLYQINNYYTLNFKSLNAIINGFLDKFELAGIKLSSKDFDYTCYVHEYMTSYLDVRNKKSKDYTMVSKIFEQIYWLNPEIIEHIELNFRKLIRKNAKKFKNYINSLQKSEMFTSNIKSYADCLGKLQEAQVELNMKQKETIGDIVELSKNGVIEIDHYLESSKIRKQAYQSLIADAVNLNDPDKMENICEALERLKININELSGYLEFSPLFKDFRDKYEKMIPALDGKKSSSKSDKGLSDIEVQINKKEIELEKINKRICGGRASIFESKNDHDMKKLKMESVMKAKELYELYKRHDEEYFNEKVKSILTGTLSVSDLLNLYFSFDYFKKLAIQKTYKLTSYDEVLKYSENFDLFAMNPTNIIITGVPVFSETNLPKIICNKYRLSSIHIEEDDLSADNLKPLLNKVSIILRTHRIEKSDISLDKIWFITKVHKYELIKEKTNE